MQYNTSNIKTSVSIVDHTGRANCLGVEKINLTDQQDNHLHLEIELINGEKIIIDFTKSI